jgi:hypothetical protein
MLEETGKKVNAIALSAGFEDGEALRRALPSRLRISPALYRKRFKRVKIVAFRADFYSTSRLRRVPRYGFRPFRLLRSRTRSHRRSDCVDLLWLGQVAVWLPNAITALTQ